ncbi:Serine protease inhibitor Kazal-type 2 [Myotis davidii]|uniref:Serine protease inhibitor Kazal-type 1 n=1 Tax=Myotis davidii TaxID=225400 RepID=L5M8P8_MYODS|nr:Serine protease inhibitor Kazal-type 2 [Myotis davidii]
MRGSLAGDCLDPGVPGVPPSTRYWRFLGPLRSLRNVGPNCNQYRLPGCPRDFNPVCGSDMSTYANECTLCMKIREDGHDIKIIRSGPC